MLLQFCDNPKPTLDCFKCARQIYLNDSLKCISAKRLFHGRVLPQRDRFVPIVCSCEETCQRLNQEALLKASPRERQNFHASATETLRVIQQVEREKHIHAEHDFISAPCLADR